MDSVNDVRKEHYGWGKFLDGVNDFTGMCVLSSLPFTLLLLLLLLFFA
jgi:hypothetical protein